MSVHLNTGRRRSRLWISDGSGSNVATILPSTAGCVLGPEAEACFNGRTTITLEQYRAGSAPRA